MTTMKVSRTPISFRRCFVFCELFQLLRPFDLLHFAFLARYLTCRRWEIVKIVINIVFVILIDMQRVVRKPLFCQKGRQIHLWFNDRFACNKG